MTIMIIIIESKFPNFKYLGFRSLQDPFFIFFLFFTLLIDTPSPTWEPRFTQSIEFPLSLLRSTLQTPLPLLSLWLPPHTHTQPRPHPHPQTRNYLFLSFDTLQQQAPLPSSYLSYDIKLDLAGLVVPLQHRLRRSPSPSSFFFSV